MSDRDIEKSRKKRYIRRRIISMVLMGTFIGLPAYKLHSLVSRGEGNRYNCKVCKNSGFACDQHIGFNSIDYIDLKVDTYGNYYVPTEHTEEESRKWMYNGDYNPYCDYCLDEEKECYTCEYDRKSIDSIMYNISTDAEFISKLNNEDWSIGYAESKQGRDMLKTEVKTKIHYKNNEN